MFLPVNMHKFCKYYLTFIENGIIGSSHLGVNNSLID